MFKSPQTLRQFLERQLHIIQRVFRPLCLKSGNNEQLDFAGHIFQSTCEQPEGCHEEHHPFQTFEFNTEPPSFLEKKARTKQKKTGKGPTMAGELNKLRTIFTGVREREPEKPQERFIAHSELKAHLNVGVVRAIIEGAECCRGLEGKIANYVIEHALVIFATLIMLEEPDLIELFYEENIDDGYLPVKINGLGRDFVVKPYRPVAGNSNALEKKFCDKVWRRRRDAEMFCDYQWLFLPQIFVENQFRYQILGKTPLPFTEVRRKLKDGDTNYSCVEERTIHRDCFPATIVRISLHMNATAAETFQQN